MSSPTWELSSNAAKLEKSANPPAPEAVFVALVEANASFPPKGSSSAGGDTSGDIAVVGGGGRGGSGWAGPLYR